MTSTAGGAFGFTSGLIIQEFGYDDDVDQALREAAGQVALHLNVGSGLPANRPLQARADSREHT